MKTEVFTLQQLVSRAGMHSEPRFWHEGSRHTCKGIVTTNTSHRHAYSTLITVFVAAVIWIVTFKTILDATLSVAVLDSLQRNKFKTERSCCWLTASPPQQSLRVVHVCPGGLACPKEHRSLKHFLCEAWAPSKIWNPYSFLGVTHLVP